MHTETTHPEHAHDHDHGHEHHHHPHLIHIIVEVTKADKRRVEFSESHVTGIEIKTRANVPTTDDLARKAHGKLEPIDNNDTITITDGEHFVALPAGSIS